MQANFQNLRTKAGSSRRRATSKGAEELRARGHESRDRERHQPLRLRAHGAEEDRRGLVYFRKNVKDYPNSWNTYDSLGEALATKGDKKGAIENYSKALAMTTDAGQKKRINGILAKLKA